MTIRAILVDDETPNLHLLRALLAAEPDLEVVGEARNGPEAVQAIRKLSPDLVFLDIQMPGLDGFEVLEELQPPERPHVVFITAYDQYSLQAFEVHALDYLLKPVSGERLHATLEHVRSQLSLQAPRPFDTRLTTFLDDLETHRARPTRFVVRTGERVEFIPTGVVEAIEATGNYMHLHVGRKSYMIRETLGNLEQRLDPHLFIRTHRSWMVNSGKILRATPWAKGAYLLILEGGTEVPVSQNYRERIDRILRSTLA